MSSADLAVGQTTFFGRSVTSEFGVQPLAQRRSKLRLHSNVSGGGGVGKLTFFGMSATSKFGLRSLATR